MKSKVVEVSSLQMKENFPSINEMDSHIHGGNRHNVANNLTNPTHLPSLLLPINDAPSFDNLKNDPINKEPVKNTIIAPVPMPIGVRVRSDSLEALKKDSLSAPDRMKSLPLDEAPVTKPSSDIFSTPEIRKSKSLTRKIKELSGSNRAVDSPTSKELESFDRAPVVRSVTSTPTITRSISGTISGSATPMNENTNGKEQLLSGHNISLLRESPNRSTNSSPSLGNMQPIRLNKMSSSAATQQNLAPLKHVVPNLTFEKLDVVNNNNSAAISEKNESEEAPMSVYQHFSLPKSVSTSSSTSHTAQKSNSTKSAKSVAIATSSSQASKFSQYNNMECILVENELQNVDKDDKAAENDRILQDRLQQAKAMGRKDDSGATLHSFSLWKSKANPTSSSNINNSSLLNTSSTSDPNSSIHTAASKSSSKLRGPKSARENQMLQSEQEAISYEEQTQQESSSSNPYQTQTNRNMQDISFTTDQNISLIKLDASFRAGDDDSYSHAYSDDEFVKDEEFTQDYSKESSDISNSTNQFSGGRKHTSLRDKVDGAKQLDASFASNLDKSRTTISKSEDIIADDLDCSYNSFAQDNSRQEGADPFLVNETSIHHEDDNMSDYSVEEDEALARELENSQNHVEFGTMSSIQTIMSRSGPAAFGSTGTVETSFEKPITVDPFAHTVHFDPKDLARRASSGGVEAKTSGMQYEPLHIRSLTSRNNKENSSSAARVDKVTSSNTNSNKTVAVKAVQPHETKPSKYQVMRNLKSAQKKTGGSNSSIIESYYDQHSSPPSQQQQQPRGSDLSREQASSPALSEISDTEDHIPHNNMILHHEKSTNDDVEQSGDDQAGSPLKWKKGEVIGEGTFGKVFKGLNEKTGELLAIKQICLADGSEKEVEEIRKEISVMWDLNHENIVRYMGTTKTERYLFIIMEYVTGGSIASMLKQFGPFSENLMRKFAFHIISGVVYLHEKSIIHRDIKGANILVTDQGVAKLADFGCSKRMAGVCTTSLEESMSALKGSVPWMAPEVIKQNRYGRSSDIWSFGATMIEMATGKPPWSNYSNNLAAMFHVATSSVPPAAPSNVSAVCAEFIKKCLVIDQEVRANAQQLLYESAFLMPEWEKINNSNIGGSAGTSLTNSTKKKDKLQRRPSGGSNFVVNLNGEAHGSHGGSQQNSESIIIGKIYN